MRADTKISFHEIHKVWFELRIQRDVVAVVVIVVVVVVVAVVAIVVIYSSLVVIGI